MHFRFVKEGDIVKEFDAICEVQSDKASVTITSRYNGTIKKLLYDVDTVAKVGKPLVAISKEKEDNSTVVEKTNVDSSQDDIFNKTRTNEQLSKFKTITSHIVPTLPSVRRMAKEHGIDLSKVSPSGRDGRVLKDDLVNYLNNLKNQTIDTPNARSTLQDKVRNNNTRKVNFSAITKAMFNKMTESLKIPHFYYSDEIDVTNLVVALKASNSDTIYPVKINALAYMVKSCSMALAAHPILNGTIGQDNQHILVKEYHNIGIAMDTKDGLIVPNIKNVEQLSILEVATEIERLKNLSNTGSLSISDLTGGTFSLSNIGSIGGIFGVPVIVEPELAIGAIGKIRKLPRETSSSGGQFEARDIVQIVWAADHRVIDGATIARFSNLWKYYLENPSMLAITLR